MKEKGMNKIACCELVRNDSAEQVRNAYEALAR